MNFTVAFSPAVPELPLVGQAFSEEIECACTAGNNFKLSVIEIVVRLKHKSQALGLALRVPLPLVVLIEKFVLHKFVGVEDESEG